MKFMTLGEIFALPIIDLELETIEEINAGNKSFSVEYLRRKHNLSTGVLFENASFIVRLLEQAPSIQQNTEVFPVRTQRSSKGSQVYLRVCKVGRKTRLFGFLRERMYMEVVFLHRVIAAFSLAPGETLNGQEVHHIGHRSLDNRSTQLEVLLPWVHDARHQANPRSAMPVPDHITDSLILYLEVTYRPQVPSIFPLAPVPVSQTSHNVDKHLNEGNSKALGPRHAIPEIRVLGTSAIIGLGHTRKKARRMATVLRTIQKLGYEAETAAIKSRVPAKFRAGRSTERALEDLITAGLIQRTKRGRYAILPAARKP